MRAMALNEPGFTGDCGAEPVFESYQSSLRYRWVSLIHSVALDACGRVASGHFNH